MATGREMYLTRQIGEHLVVAELGRLGLVATPFAGNVPDFDLVAVDERHRSVPIQVKAIRGPSWQFNVSKFLDVEIRGKVQHVRGKVKLSNPEQVCVFVKLRESAEGRDRFFVFRLGDLQRIFKASYKGGRRPRNPNSLHCAVWPHDLGRYEDRWATVFANLRRRKPRKSNSADGQRT